MLLLLLLLLLLLQIPVPSNWECYGHGTPIYTNCECILGEQAPASVVAVACSAKAVQLGMSVSHTMLTLFGKFSTLTHLWVVLAPGWWWGLSAASIDALGARTGGVLTESTGTLS
jgi:hypothetical protein